MTRSKYTLQSIAILGDTVGLTTLLQVWDDVRTFIELPISYESSGSGP